MARRPGKSGVHEQIIGARWHFGNTKTKNFEGYATITDCKELTVKDLKKFGDKHRANEFIDEYADVRELLLGFYPMYRSSRIQRLTLGADVMEVSFRKTD